MNTIQENIAAVKKLIASFEEKYGRDKGSVQLLAVSKGQSAEKIEKTFQAGQRLFGENYLQEALEKMRALQHLTDLSAHPGKQDAKPDGIEWHFIGPVQSNKTRKIAEHFAWVHCVDSMKNAKRLSEQRPAALLPLNICIQVNVSQEATKSGVDIDDVLPLVKYCSTLPALKLRGLMTIPEEETDFSLQCAAFHKLFLLWQTLRQQGFMLDTLSMGMSNDFEAAIAEGSTIVRIGTSIFGKRI